ncbi:MAG: hypothetical protein U0984_05090 [Prosthecobacter sp.]|nr:hypothetical protein [Prosthecobacter sp.]
MPWISLWGMESAQPDEKADEIDEAGEVRRDGADLCVYCFAEIEVDYGQCRRCGAPVTMTPWE